MKQPLVNNWIVRRLHYSSTVTHLKIFRMILKLDSVQRSFESMRNISAFHPRSERINATLFDNWLKGWIISFQDGKKSFFHKQANKSSLRPSPKWFLPIPWVCSSFRMHCVMRWQPWSVSSGGGSQMRGIRWLGWVGIKCAYQRRRLV